LINHQSFLLCVGQASNLWKKLPVLGKKVLGLRQSAGISAWKVE
jgi:hypothetical protein